MSFLKKKQSDIPRRRLVTDVKPQPSSEMFRRGRTLTGSKSNNLNVVSAKSDLESPRTKVHHLSIRRRKLSGILLGLAALIALLWYFLSNFIAVTSISVLDSKVSKTIDTSIYQEAIQGYMDLNPLSRFIFWLDETVLSNYVSGKLPEVSGVTVQENSIKKPGEIDFAITFREPVAGWNINERQYYVDSSGISFERNYFNNPLVQIMDNSGISPQAGTAIASKRFLGFVGRIVALADSSGYTVTRAVLPANTTRELDINIKEASYYIKLSIDRPAGEQIEDMSRAIGYFTKQKQVPKYIDVRVSGKAFYRL